MGLLYAITFCNIFENYSIGAKRANRNRNRKMSNRISFGVDVIGIMNSAENRFANIMKNG